jgi:type IV secretion system protein VirD4
MSDTVGYKSRRTPIRTLGIPILIFCIYFTAVNVALTQWIAENFSYHSALGNIVFQNYYYPWKWISWTLTFSPAYPNFFAKVYVAVGAGAAGAVLLLMLFAIKARRVTQGNSSLHGTAHFATEKDVKQSGLYRNDNGVFVGGYQKSVLGKKEYMRHNGKEHIFVFAPTRAGKGVGLILPTLLSWVESVFVLDIKGENFALTAGWRKEHANNHVIRFQPNCEDGTGSCFNPFEEVRLNTDAAFTDVDNIINIVAAPENPRDRVDPHFDPLAKTFLTGCALHWLYLYQEHGEHLTLPALNMEISSDNVDDYLDEMIESAYTDASVNIARQMKERRANSPKEAGGIISTAQKYLRLYNDPIVAKNMRKSDFKIADLMRAEKAVSFYLVIPPSQIDRFAPLTRMIVDTIVQRLASEMEFSGGQVQKNYNHRLLMMLDEFPAFGCIPTFEKALGFLAGYGIKAYVITQDKIQLKKAYTQDQTITTNCGVHIAYPPNELETAKVISNMLGETTVVKKKVTTSGTRSGIYANRMSISTDEIKRPLMTPDEVARMRGPEKDIDGNITKAGEMLIFQTGKPPIRGTQILHFEDPTFLARSKVPPPEKGDVIK